jgi:hypothetical protein
MNHDWVNGGSLEPKAQHGLYPFNSHKAVAALAAVENSQHKSLLYPSKAMSWHGDRELRRQTQAAICFGSEPPRNPVVIRRSS